MVPVMRRLWLLLLLSAAACSSDDPYTTVPATAPVSADPSRAITIAGDLTGLFPGARVRLQVGAKNAERLPVSTDAAQLTLSDPSVATIVSAGSIAVSYPQLGRSTLELVPELIILAPGQTKLRATLDGASAEITLDVRSIADGMPALAVDSFAVVEYRASCAFNCPYLVYAPLLRLREVTGRSAARVVGVEFTIPRHTTGVCRGLVEFAAGTSAHVNGIDPYLWNNDLIFVETSGTPVPDGLATARVWVESEGVTRVLNAAAEIRRNVLNPQLPPLLSSWSC